MGWKNCLFAQQSFPLLLFHMPVSHKYHGYRALSVVRQSLAPYSVRFLFEYVCVSAPHMCYIWNPSAMLFSFCACMSLNNLFHTKKKVKKGSFAQLEVWLLQCRWSCLREHALMPFSQRCLFFGKAAIAVAVGCRSKCALVFLVFRHLGAHATMTQCLYTQDYANCCCYRLFSRYSSLWPKYKEEKKDRNTRINK